KHEELEEMRTDFDKPGNLFLTAKTQGRDEVIGVLGLRYRNTTARIRRWEPAVIPAFLKSSAAESLLNQAIKHLVSMGIKSVSCLIKYPVSMGDSFSHHLDLYRETYFEKSRPDSVDLITSLRDVIHPSKTPQGVYVETGEEYEFEELASIVVNSFTSTPEEREIHGFDKTVTEHIQATALLQRMAEGFYGYSPDDLRKIAVAEGIPVGFVSAFLLESKYKPLTGVVGPVAILPDYRRRGIALHLIKEILYTLKEHGCEYAAIGTPAANEGAIALYEKVGFTLSCQITNLEKEI
ncbi:MAG: GNAT family N-acetyltransferase, partial [Candidatus Thorarchaeota archaeon SMTZ1-45]